MRRENQVERQKEMNATPGAARTVDTAVKIETIDAKLRSITCPVVRKIDLKLSCMPDYCKLELLPYFCGLQNWQRHKALCDVRKGMPSGTIEHWSWMPGGGRAGLAAHVIWKVCCLDANHDR